MFMKMYKQALTVIGKKPVMLWGLSLLSVVISAIAGLVTAPIVALGFCATTLINCGMVKVYLDGLAGKEVNSTQLFAAFNKNCVRIVGGMAWQALWIIIWCLVPIVGPIIAIVKAYSYSFVPYILMTKPEVSATDALKLSMKMTDGKKGQLFLADFCAYAGIFAASFVLGLFSAIPIIGVLFSLVLAVFLIAVALFMTIFVGLYKAAFFVEISADFKEVPAEAAVAE